MKPGSSIAIPSPRRATLEDLPAVAALHRLAFFTAMPHMPVLHTPGEDLAFYRTMVFPMTEMWLIESDGLVAGFIAFRAGQVDHLYVHPGHQRRGVGSALFALALRDAGAAPIRVWTFQCNLPARRFYEKLGFRIELETDGADNEERQPDVLYVSTGNSA